MGLIGKIKKQIRGFGRKQDEIYWGLVFNNAIADSSWFLKKSLNPGRWAAGYPLLYVLYRVYNDIKPKVILEFGLGESTKLLAQYKKNHCPKADFRVIEQNQAWVDFFCKEIFDIGQNIQVVEIEKSHLSGLEVFSYKNILDVVGGKKYDFIFVDGPWGSDTLSRYQIVDIAENNLLAEEFIIIMHDYERMGEKQTAAKLREVLRRNGIAFVEAVYSGEKDTILICSKKYEFLVSL